MIMTKAVDVITHATLDIFIESMNFAPIRNLLRLSSSYLTS